MLSNKQQFSTYLRSLRLPENFLRNPLHRSARISAIQHHVNYNLYHIFPLPIKIKDADIQFTSIVPEREYMLMDMPKRYYANS
jgi:hypothetical protein